MEIAPLKMTDPWSSRVRQDSRANSVMLREVPTEVAVDMSRAEILHHSEQLNFRPYLHLQGQIQEFAPDVELPFGVTKLPFRQGTGPQLDAFYEFTDAQLADLVVKGYFTEDFAVPEQMEQIVWDLPAKADYLMVFPEYADQSPIVFVGVHDQNDLTLTEASSDYDLHTYFPNYSAQREVGVEEQIESAKQTQAQRARGDVQDLFADIDLEVPEFRDEDAAALAPGQDEDVPSSVFDQLLVKAREERELLEQQHYQDQLNDPDSAESLYASRIAPAVEQALAPAAEQVLLDAISEPEHTEDQQQEGFLDFLGEEAEQELGPDPISTENPGAKAREQAARRTEKLDSQGDQDRELGG